MIEEDKVTLARQRAELVAKLAGPLPPPDRVHVQGELSLINAKIKALNTTQAAQLKVAADRRKVSGLAEFQANSARAMARIDGPALSAAARPEDDDPARTKKIDDWIVAVLRRGGVKVHRAKDGNLDILDAPAKWVAIVQALCDGLHAAARGEELPEVTSAPKESSAKKRS